LRRGFPSSPQTAMAIPVMIEKITRPRMLVPFVYSFLNSHVDMSDSLMKNWPDYRKSPVRQNSLQAFV
jgi:hypothetical protein